MKSKSILLAAFLAHAMGAPSPTFAMAGKDRVVARGQQAKAMPGWPKGTLAVINHPLRADGWHPWFSECPNDTYYYEMDVRTPEDVQSLIKSFAAIKSETLRLRIQAAEVVHERGVGATFSLGNQQVLDRWYQALPEVEPGVRRFGMHHYHEPPTSMPPTLTLYAGHEAVDLESLKVPLNIEIIGPDGTLLSAEPADNDRYIDPFARSHDAREKKDSERKAERGD